LNELLQALKRRARSTPEDPVLFGVDGSISATDLLQKLEEVGAYLRRRCVKTIAIYAENSPDWAILDLASQHESTCMVPVPTFFTSEQTQYLLDAARVELLFFDTAMADKLPQHLLDLSKPVPALPGLSEVSLPAGSVPLMPAATTKITFTSGSTGTPKGVCLSYEQCLKVAYSLSLAIEFEAPRHLAILPLATLLENIGGIYMPILAGGATVLLPTSSLGMSGSSSFDASKFLAALELHQPNTLILVPQLLVVLDQAMSNGWVPPKSLRFVAVGGARVAKDLVERVRMRGLPVYEGYGLSESASVVSLNCPAHDRPGTSGRVLPHLSVAERNGEIEVSGNTFLGYLDRPSSWYLPTVATGDIGTIDSDGYVTITGRSKNIIVSSFGRNISPEWVESELLASGEFMQALVFGHARPFCYALIYPVDSGCDTARIEHLIDDANRKLPDYAQVRRWIRLQQPLTAEDGLLTDNGRPRRDKIESFFSSQLNSLYSDAVEAIA
jgi:long-chain acyl-CoA synthetase